MFQDILVHIDKTQFASAIVSNVLNLKKIWNLWKGKERILLLIIQHLILQNLSIGHLRSRNRGSIYRIYKHLGYNCIGVNHLGDWEPSLEN